MVLHTDSVRDVSSTEQRDCNVCSTVARWRGGRSAASVATSAAQSGVCARAVGPTGRNRAALSPLRERPATLLPINALDTVPLPNYKKVSHFYVSDARKISDA